MTVFNLMMFKEKYRQTQPWPELQLMLGSGEEARSARHNFEFGGALQNEHISQVQIVVLGRV